MQYISYHFMAQLQSFIVESELEGTRADKYLATCLPKISRTKIKGLIENGNLKVNNITITEPKYALNYLDKVSLKVVVNLGAANVSRPIALKFKELEVIYEDEYLIIINKPAKLLVHGGAGRSTQETLVDYLMKHCGSQLSKIGGEARPGIVHRLDMETSGLMVVAKDDRTHTLLGKMFESHSIIRKYKGFCMGQPVPKIGRMQLNLKKCVRDKTRVSVCSASEGKVSVTNYKVLKSYMEGRFSMVEFQLQTGRTHQIRVHMEYKRTPIVADKVYGKRFSFNLVGFSELNSYIKEFKRHALHSYYIQFMHPITEEELEFEIDLPEDLKQLESWLSGMKR